MNPVNDLLTAVPRLRSAEIAAACVLESSIEAEKSDMEYRRVI
jgi:hypothetical protein